MDTCCGAGVRTTTILNEFGDVTLAWEEESDDAIREVIQKKMKEGVAFFIIKPRWGGFLPPRKARIKNIREVNDERIVSMKDEDFVRLMESGSVAVVKSQGKVETIRRAETAEEVASNHTVGVPQRAGG